MSCSGSLRCPFPKFREACQLALGYGTPRRAARLAAVVGTLLVLINQWEAVVAAASMDWMKVALTYCVPYMVSTYTSVSKDLYLRREAEAAEQSVHEEAQKTRFQEDPS
ncbi:nitrate/nitrite transporter NrtS [Marinobacter sediminum]|uniref:nitrate/nitrite transporter NrtS n=1 Tax=Marinobacter sediminum TaxID=256323 RepID=UPI0020307E38|nr:nitrate/nitrite transporter NrtS [Marinobacter sediminum]MCM0614011.1 nitrate/nitrite transporter NrtS [Marinobacter sediminum]